jgi:hypothetical protein
VGDGEVRPELHGLLELGDGLLHERLVPGRLPLLLERVAEIAARVGEVRAQAQRLLVVLDRG